MRLALRLATLVVVAGLLYGGATFAQVWSASRRDQARPAEAIVVFGAAQYNGVPSPVLRARLDHALSLWRRGLARDIWVTGGSQPGDRFTEATASANYLLARGVPDARVRREISGHSSWQSLAAVAPHLERNDDVLLVSDPFHSYRIGAIAQELGLRGHPSPTRTSPITGVGATPYLVRETVAVAVGRVVGFRRQAHIDEAVRTRV